MTHWFRVVLSEAPRGVRRARAPGFRAVIAPPCVAAYLEVRSVPGAAQRDAARELSSVRKVAWGAGLHGGG